MNFYVNKGQNKNLFNFFCNRNKIYLFTFFSILDTPGASGVTVVTRKYLYDLMQTQNLSNMDEKLTFLENYLLARYGDSPDNLSRLKQRFAYFKSSIKEKWTQAHRKESIFLKNNAAWLEGSFEIIENRPTRPGRPFKSFEDSSDRTKRRKTKELRSSFSDELIVHAAQTSLQTQGKRDASQILKDLTISPTRAGKYRKAYKNFDQKKITPLSPLQALAMFVEADLTRRQYEIIRNTNKSFYPCYDLLLKEKKECYPPEESMNVTKTCAESTLQCLINKTVQRLSVALEEILCSLKPKERNSLKILCKWGCDGSQQAKYKQKFDDEEASDAHIFLSSFVPLRIFCDQDGHKVIWQNPTPSSPRYCRPIRFRFTKETTDVTKEEISYVEESVKRLQPTEIFLNGNKFMFDHVFKMTMVDGKVCNAATDTKSTSQCYICGSTSKDFNNLTKNLNISSTAIEFGLSVLHTRIRIFESILHLAYKLPVKKYREKRTEEEKELEGHTKKHIQERFRKETGLLVDMPKANFGNTNDGNTSRRFFENPQLSAEITKVDFQLIYRLKVILETISSGHKIDIQQFDEYAMDTAKLYVELYGWHPMTPTMHKILIHGSVIIKNALLPIGQLSEEAAEARNKHFRLYRENYARKFSREECNIDIYNRLLLSSDPLLSIMKQTKKRIKVRSFCPETIKMLLPADPNESSTSDTDEEI